MLMGYTKKPGPSLRLAPPLCVFALRLCAFIVKFFVKTKKGRLAPALISSGLKTYFCFSSIASSVCVAEVTIGVPGPKILAAPAAYSSS